MDHHYSLLQPLTTTTVPSAPTHFPANLEFAGKSRIYSSNRAIAFRLFSIFFIAIISIWANFEASKGFEVTIINEARRDSLAGKRFALFYVSDDKATRTVLNASNFVEDLLYPNGEPKKQINHVTLRLSGRKMTETVAVKSSSGEEHSFVIDINSLVMEEENVNHHAMESAILRGMARVWLWDGESGAPPEILAGIVEYINMVAGFGERSYSSGAGELPECRRQFWWEDEGAKVVAKFLNYWEENDKGFIRRLNRGLKDRWYDRTVDDALGVQATQGLCVSYNVSSTARS